GVIEDDHKHLQRLAKIFFAITLSQAELSENDLQDSALDKTTYMIFKNNDVSLEQIENFSVYSQLSNDKKLKIGSIVNLFDIIFGRQDDVEETSTTMQRLSNM
ncbi:630_t:CDS:2, partial [Cetraspora pellucida]